MSTPRMTALLALLLVWAAPVRADDGDTPARVRRTMDLRAYRLPAAPAGPRIASAADLVEAGDEPHASSVWSLDAFEDGTWLPFRAPSLEDRAVSPDALVELLQAALGGAADAENMVIEADEARLYLDGPEELVARAAAQARWVLAGIAPSVRVDATLWAAAPGEEERLAALGGVRLSPNRWTRVYLRTQEVPCAPYWDIEVAEEATIMDPQVVPAREGEELYLRYHPGESVSVVEIWAGTVEHLEMARVDLSGVRNVPEASGPGVLSFPRSAVDRAFAHVLLPAGQAARHELRWSNEGRGLRLTLAFGAPPSPAPELKLAGGSSLALLRPGALADRLGFEARASATSAWIERTSGLLYAVGQEAERAGRSFDFSLSAVDGGSIAFLEVPSPQLASVRDALIAEERTRLAARRVGLRVLAVPEVAYRSALQAGGVRVGAPVAAEVLAAFRAGGAAPAETVTLPLLLGVPAGFRVGRSIPGLSEMDAELAQRSGGLRPLTTARFAGLRGDVEVRASAGGHAARVRATISWARADAGTLEVNMRAPVSMSGKAGDGEQDARLVRLPMLGGGEVPVAGEVVVAGGEAREMLVHAHVQGGDVVLLLLSLR